MTEPQENTDNIIEKLMNQLDGLLEEGMNKGIEYETFSKAYFLSHKVKKVDQHNEQEVAAVVSELKEIITLLKKEIETASTQQIHNDQLQSKYEQVLNKEVRSDSKLNKGNTEILYDPNEQVKQRHSLVKEDDEERGKKEWKMRMETKKILLEDEMNECDKLIKMKKRELNEEIDEMMNQSIKEVMQEEMISISNGTKKSQFELLDMSLKELDKVMDELRTLIGK